MILYLQYIDNNDNLNLERESAARIDGPVRNY
jgi:hypothetical protein